MTSPVPSAAAHTAPGASEPESPTLAGFAAAAARARHGVPLSVLDLVSVTTDAHAALEASMANAVAAEEAGYFRYWFAEHHNSAGVASSATAVIIALAAARTRTMRIGSGGIMLPNHAPLAVAEAFGTIAQLEPGRIDLGLGRAPGTDPVTSGLLNHFSPEPKAFAQAIYDLQGWLSDGTGHSTPVRSVSSAGTHVPIWVLGSTVNGASIAGQLGLPFAVASHFQPDGFDDALATYHRTFSTDSPTAQLTAPHTMLAVNVLAADTEAEATRLFTTAQQMFIAIRRGQHGPIPAPVDDLSTVATPLEIAMVQSVLRVHAVGTPDHVVHQLDALVESTGANEIITTTYATDPAVVRHSQRLLAEAWLT